MFGLVKEAHLNEALDSLKSAKMSLEDHAATVATLENEVTQLKQDKEEAAQREGELQEQIAELKAHPCFTAYRNLEAIKQQIEADQQQAREDIERAEKDLDRMMSTLRERSAELKSIETEIEYAVQAQEVKNVAKDFYGPGAQAARERMEDVVVAQKTLIKDGKACEFYGQIQWDNSLVKGKAQQNRAAKFMLTAFNAETQNLIRQCTVRNFTQTVKKIERWYDRINKFGEDNFCRLSRNYLQMKLDEHRYAFEYHMRQEFEKEEERYARECQREEKKLEKEIEKFVKAREAEEKGFKSEIEKARMAAKDASAKEIEELNQLIKQLTEKLDRATKEKERALSMAQLTRSGNVYILSNKGSFGEGIYKIGMTRRLDPYDRVKELSGASVPFLFDVHALIPSEDAPGLEHKLHTKFSDRRVNKANERREYFRVSLEEVQEALRELGEDVEITAEPDAREWLITQELLESEDE